VREKKANIDSNLTKASECKPIDYPKPDGVLSFDLMTNLIRSGLFSLFSLHSFVHFSFVQVSFFVFLLIRYVMLCLGTNHNHNQPSHLKLHDPNLPLLVNLPLYAVSLHP
jgi:electron-transferring-flavoprotein dehydrogenase